MAGTMTDMLAVARREIGVREKPSGSNKVKYTKWYPMIGPWCAMFVSWSAEQAGVPTSVIPKHAYTPSGVAWFKAQGRYKQRAKVGDIVYYEFPGMGRVSHVGIVEKVHGPRDITAIEGNTDAAGGRTGGKVMRKRRSGSIIDGFGRPAYRSTASVQAAVGEDEVKQGSANTGKSKRLALKAGTWNVITWENHGGDHDGKKGYARLLSGAKRYDLEFQYHISGMPKGAEFKVRASERHKVAGSWKLPDEGVGRFTQDRAASSGDHYDIYRAKGFLASGDALWVEVYVSTDAVLEYGHAVFDHS